MNNPYILPILLALFAFSATQKEKQIDVGKKQKEIVNKVEKKEEVVSEQIRPVVEDKEEKKNKYVVGDKLYIQYSADWCGPCQTLKRMVKGNTAFQNFIKEKTKGYFIVDINSDNPLYQRWEKLVRISSIPTVVLFEFDGKKWVPKKQISGLQGLNKIKNMYY